MPIHTLTFLDATNFTVNGGEYNPGSITITGTGLSTIDVFDNDGDLYFDGDNEDPNDEIGEDDTQFIAGTPDQVYIERSYTLDIGGTDYQVYIVEVGGVVQGMVFPDGQPPIPSTGTFTVTASQNVTNGVDASGTGAIPAPEYPDLEMPCFVRGSMIETDRGEVAIEDLQPGDMVRTMDSGLQPVRWVGSSIVRAHGDLAPIRFAAGAFGNTRDLMVSPKHRMLLQGWQLDMLFDSREALVTADALLNDSTITRVEGGQVEYFHVMFDRHQIIFAEGCPSESFYPASTGLDKLAEATRDELLALFPQLEAGVEGYGPAVRDTLQAREVALVTEGATRRS